MCSQNRYSIRPPLRVVCAGGCKIVDDDLEQVAARLVVPDVTDGAIDAQDAVAMNSQRNKHCVASDFVPQFAMPLHRCRNSSS